MNDCSPQRDTVDDMTLLKETIGFNKKNMGKNDANGWRRQCHQYR